MDRFLERVINILYNQGRSYISHEEGEILQRLWEIVDERLSDEDKRYILAGTKNGDELLEEKCWLCSRAKKECKCAKTTPNIVTE